jgi:maleate isomerase
MPDSLGYRRKFGVVAPSTNTTVQPEYDAMRPAGVTNHFSRAVIPDIKVTDNASFRRMTEAINAALLPAVDAVITCKPDYVVLGLSGETFADGLKGSDRMKKQFERRAGMGVSMPSDACRKAFKQYGRIKRLGVITPYMPVGDAQVRRFFTECGFEVINVKGLKCGSPTQIAQVSERELRDAVIAVNRGKVDAILQVGTNLAMARLAGVAEFWLDKPVIAVNTATYWYALRENGIADRIAGFGSLLAEH